MGRPQSRPTARRMDSIYRLPKDAPDPIYGEFPNCQILGDPCTIKVASLPDGASEAVDILGFSSFRRGGIAIHISGMDDFGHRDVPRLIHGIGIQECIWDRPGRHPSGTGCSKPDPVVMLSGGPDRHFALWGRADGFVTLEGIFIWDSYCRSAFTAEDVAATINMGRQPYLHLGDRQTSAIRRLLEASVGVSNNGITSDDGKIGVARLVRAGGRYKYRFARTEGDRG